MKRASTSTVSFQQTTAPFDTPAGLRVYLDARDRMIANAIRLLALGHLDPTRAAPERPEDGDFRLAVAPWDPGSGDGFYFYLDGAWKPMAGGGGSAPPRAPTYTTPPSSPGDGDIVLAVAPWNPDRKSVV